MVSGFLLVYIDFSVITCSDNNYMIEDLSEQIIENCSKLGVNLNYKNNRPEKVMVKSIKSIYEKFEKTW